MFISQENNLLEHQKAIEAFWQQQVVQSTLCCDDYELQYAYVIPEKATRAVVISSGRIESLLKYKELIWEFVQNNYAVFIVDHRGQGLSSRKLANKHKGYIVDFKDYTNDFALFNQRIVDTHWQGKKYLLAHSMGAAIAALYLKNYPHNFEKVAFCSPMFGINLGSTPLWFVKGIVKTLLKFGAGESYALGQGDYLAKPFNKNQLTQSALRYQLFRQTYQQNPAIQLGGVTVAWLNAALSAIKELNHTTLSLPVLLLQAGQDEIVENSAQDSWLVHNKNAEYKLFATAKHELLCEQDTIRTAVITSIYTFFDFLTTDCGS